MIKTISAKNLEIIAFNWETEKRETIITSVEWAMTEKRDGYWLEDEDTQIKNIKHYLNSVANIANETIYELISFQIK